MNNFYNLDIERGILSGLLTDFSEINEVEFLKPDDFYLAFHQEVFKTMLENKNNEFFDELILKDILQNRNLFDENMYLELLATTPFADLKSYAKIIKEYSLKRKLNILLKQKEILLKDKNVFELIEDLKQQIDELEKTETFSTFNFYTLGSVEDRDIEFLLKDFIPIPKKAVTLLSARGGSGKSWLALNLATRLTNEDQKVFAWLSEDPNFATKKRFKKLFFDVLMQDGEFISNKLKHFDFPQYDKFFKFLGSETRPFHFIEYDFKSKKINPLFYQFKQALKDFDVIILDPLIAFYGGDENNNSQAREFMNLLTEWADKEDKAIIVIHHNNKSIDGGIRGASAFVDAVRLHYELIVPKKDENNQIPDTHRILRLMKDNWGVRRFFGEEKTIQVFPKFEKIEKNNPSEISPQIEVPTID